VTIHDDMVELGLAKTCSHVVITQERGRMYKDYCPNEVLTPGGKCSRHDTSADLVKQAKIATAQRIRKELEEDLLPLATERVRNILAYGEDVKASDIIRIWATIMDRTGIPAVSGVNLQADVQVSAPLDVLRQMLGQVQGVEGGEGDIVEGEVVGEGEGG
jgi:hypothetical protein